MAEADNAPTFGGELKDAFKPVNAWVANGVAWLDDIQQFYRERSVIEKDYSAKLSALAKKFIEKKAKKSSSLSVGDSPQLTPGSLESASLTTWNTQLMNLESRAAEHDRLAASLVSRLADPLKYLGAKYEEIRRRHAEYAYKLERERDASYAELKKVKSTYDNACQELEARRKKVDLALEHGKPKAQNAYQQQSHDAHNIKNTYLIAVNVTNLQSEKYYHEYVPDLLDSLQDLSETRTAKLNTIWSRAAQLEKATLTRDVEGLEYLLSEIPRNNPSLDSIMFIRHNVTAWQEPPNLVFEPSPVWHDDAEMMVDEESKTFLRNLLGKSTGQRAEMKVEVEKKRKELDNVKRIRASVREGTDKRDEVGVVAAILALQEELHRVDHRRLALEVEASIIQAAVGDLTRGARNHAFKPQTFKIPTNCDLCGDRIWGLSAKGFDCRDCGYTCHSKCEMKVPAACPGEQSKDDRRKLKAERQGACQAITPASHGLASNGGPPAAGVAAPPAAIGRSNTMNSLSSGYATSARRSTSVASASAPTDESVSSTTSTQKTPSQQVNAPRRNRVMAPPPQQYVRGMPGPEAGSSSMAMAVPSEPSLSGKMLYAYQGVGPGELSVDEGRDVVILQADDGSGWMKVRTGVKEGVVPMSYVQMGPVEASPRPAPRPDSTYSNSSVSLAGSTTGSKKKGPAVAPKRGAKKLEYVEAMYDYEARSDAEWSMNEGDRFVIVHRDAGDGWAEVEKGGIVKSVPANYVHDV